MPSVCILIVDDHERIRSGVRSILSSRPEWSVCGEAQDGAEAVEKARLLTPNVILMDITMPRMDGLSATRIIHREIPKAQVIIISQNDAALLARQASAVNACAFIAKENLSADLLPTIDRVIQESFHA